MDLLNNAETPLVSIGNELDRTDNNQEQPATSGSDSRCLEPKTIQFDNTSSMKQDEMSVHEVTLEEIAFNNERTGTWNNEQPQKPKLNALLRATIGRNIKPNVTIRIADKTFKCYMVVLKCYSKYFKQRTTEVDIRLPENKVTPQAFQMVYEWMLSEKYHIIPAAMCEIFSAARYLDIEELLRQCWFCFGDTDCYREDTAFLMYMEASKAGHKDLEQLMLMRVSKFFLTVVSSRDFLELTENELCSLLSSNVIGVNSEIDVLFSAVRWLTHNWEERNQFQVNVVKCVRFSLMPSWFLITLTKDAVSPNVLKVVKHPKVQQMISDGLSFVSTQMFYFKTDVQFYQYIKDMELTPSPQRTWIYDEHCDYSCFATYEFFNVYLGRIRILEAKHWRQLKLAKDVNDTVSNEST